MFASMKLLFLILALAGNADSALDCTVNCPKIDCRPEVKPNFNCPSMDCPDINIGDISCGGQKLAKQCSDIKIGGINCQAPDCEVPDISKYVCPPYDCPNVHSCPRFVYKSVPFIILIIIVVSLVATFVFAYKMYKLKVRQNQTESRDQSVLGTELMSRPHHK